MKKISIITVNYNNSDGLINTLESVELQNISRDKFKYVIVDGNSNDKSKDVIYSFSKKTDIDLSIIIEDDDGVYDAMNKGIEQSDNGSYMIFLNSGDYFHDGNVLQKCFHLMEKDRFSHNVYYGDKINPKSGIEKAFKPSSLKFGIINACHQSIFYKKCNVRYSLRYKVFSDYDFTCVYYNRFGGFSYLDNVISVFEGSGMSSRHSWNTKKEIYIINMKQFGLFNFIKFLFSKLSFLIGKKHLIFLEKHTMRLHK